jgi:TolA-binding protein
MLKLGLISTNSGKKTEAKQIFQDIKKQFPGSSAAHLAALELQKL